MKKIFKIIFITLAILIVVGAITVISILSWYGYKTSSGYIDKITKESVESNNSSLCDKIQPEFMGPDGRAGCYNQVAIENKNINACVGYGSSCYYAYFQSYKNEDRSVCPKAAEDNTNTEKLKTELENRTTGPGTTITVVTLREAEINGCYQAYDAVQKIK